MESIEEVQEQRKINFWKWTCGGCLVVVLLLTVVTIVGLYSLARWEKGKSAWEHMPPSTLFAIETHDINTLLSRGLKDPGIRSILKKFSDRIEDAMAEASGESRSAYNNFVNDLSEGFEAFSPFFTMAAPNLGTAGVCTSDVADVNAAFIMFRPPTWLRMSIGESFGDSISHSTSSDGIALYTFSKDGWYIIATTETLAGEIRDNWDNPALPLGPGPGRSDPYLALALRVVPDGEAGDEPLETGDTPSSPPVALSNPFGFSDAPEPATEVEIETPGEGRAIRILLVPDGGGWTLEGEVVGKDGAFSGVLSEEVAKSLPPVRGDQTPDFQSDVEILVKAGRGLMQEGEAYLRARFDGSLSGFHPEERELAWAWLNDAWLDNADGAAALYVKKAAAKKVDGVPPLPVFSLAWRMKDNADAAEAASEFTESLTRLLDRVIDDKEGTSVSRALRQSVAYSVEETAAGRGGVVTIPPVMANSANPAWFFPKDVVPGLGWMASDPSGIDRAPKASIPAWKRLAAPGEERLGVTAAWNVSTDFREDLFEVLLDRWETLEAGDDTEEEDGEGGENGFDWMGKKERPRLLHAIRYYITAFPRGDFDAVYDRDAERCLFRAKIPAGVNVAW